MASWVTQTERVDEMRRPAMACYTWLSRKDKRSEEKLGASLLRGSSLPPLSPFLPQLQELPPSPQQTRALRRYVTKLLFTSVFYEGTKNYIKQQETNPRTK